MGRIAAGLALLSVACVSNPTPVSLTAMMHVQIREQAGLYPPDWVVTGSAHAGQLATLKAWAEHNEIVVTVAKLNTRHLLGSTQPGYGGWVILLSQDIEPDAQLRTLLHELGHVYGPKAPTEPEREVIAEMVSAMTCERLGLHVWPQATAYLATVVPDLELQTRTVQREGVKLDALVAALTKAAGR
jgi:hypothetical protein